MSTTDLVKIIALSPIGIDKVEKDISFILVDGEVIQSAYKSIRDKLAITNKRIITIDKQGLTGKKIEYLSIPFNKVTSFSLETAGTFDLDAELKVWVSGLGKFELQFVKGTDIKPIAKMLSNYIVGNVE